MLRKLDKKLDSWAKRPRRHPLILRGARQVGKTYLVRELGKRLFKNYLELNFEQDTALSRLFLPQRRQIRFVNFFPLSSQRKLVMARRWFFWTNCKLRRSAY